MTEHKREDGSKWKIIHDVWWKKEEETLPTAIAATDLTSTTAESRSDWIHTRGLRPWLSMKLICSVCLRFPRNMCSLPVQHEDARAAPQRSLFNVSVCSFANTVQCIYARTGFLTEQRDDVWKGHSKKNPSCFYSSRTIGNVRVTVGEQMWQVGH